MMKLLWTVVLLAILGLAAVQAQQELSPVELVESGSGSTSVDDGIIYDGGFLEVDAEDHAELDLEDANELESESEEENFDDAALIEIEGDAETDAETETEQEVDQSADESEDRSLLEKAKAGAAKAGAKKADAKAGAKKADAKADTKATAAEATKAPKAPKAKEPKAVKAPKAKRPKAEKSLPAPASDAKAIVQTGRGRKGRNCRGSRCRGRKHGWGIAPAARKRVQQRLPAPRLTGAAATLTRANVRCVLCQFITQKLKNGLTGADDSAAAASASLIEAFAFASTGAQSRIESTVEAAAYADASASAVPSLFDHGADAPRRFRHTDVLAHRAARARFTQQRSGSAVSAEQEEQRAAYLKLYSTVYASFEDLCAKKMPLAYLPYCNDMLKSYRFFAQGINYADRPEQICMNGNFCDHRSYVRRVTHNTYQREPGDA